MVDREITDGYRIAELLASEIDGRRSGPLAPLSVADPDRTVEGTPEGERAYDVRRLEGDRDPRREPTPEDAGALFAQVFVHEDRARVAVREGVEAAAQAGETAGLRIRPKAVEPPRTLLFVERGADVKRAADALAAASRAADQRP